MSAIVNTEIRNCGNFHAPSPMLPGYVQCWPFNCSMCSHCGDVGVDWGWLKMFVWDSFFGWWWEGAVLVENHPEAATSEK